MCWVRAREKHSAVVEFEFQRETQDREQLQRERERHTHTHWGVCHSNLVPQGSTTQHYLKTVRQHWQKRCRRAVFWRVFGSAHGDDEGISLNQLAAAVSLRHIGERDLTQTRREGDSEHAHTHTGKTLLLCSCASKKKRKKRKSSGPALVLCLLLLFLEKWRVFIIGTQKRQSMTSLYFPILSAGWHVCLQSHRAGTSTVNMHRCRNRSFVCVRWELLNSNLEAVDFPSFTRPTTDLRLGQGQGKISLTLWRRYEWQIQPVGLQLVTPCRFAQLLSVSLPFWGAIDG